MQLKFTKCIKTSDRKNNRKSYRLAEHLKLIAVDTIAQSLDIALDSVKRCRAALQHVLATTLQNGHVYASRC
jgi:hypothetical protein